jgi:TetR/AcrR family transcriptional regulator
MKESGELARARATDYEEKRQSILDQSAVLFASLGYQRASMRMIADANRISKALLYHYYQDKEELLFDVLRYHFEGLLQTIELAAVPAAKPKERLLAMVTALIEAYQGADAKHKLQINDLGVLSAQKQAQLKAIQRAIVSRFRGAVVAALPGLEAQKNLLGPVTMSLFGMINWNFLWFNPEGRLSRKQYAALVTELIVEGARKLEKPKV